MTRGRIVLAAPSLDDSGGGVAHVAGLLQRACEAAWPGDVSRCTLLARGDRTPSLAEKLRFASRMWSVQASGRARGIVFAHLGLANVQRALPRPLRAPYAVFLHGIESWKPLPEPTRTILRQAAVRLTNSDFTARRVVEANGDLGEIDICPLALPALPELASRSARSADDPLDVLIVGRMAAGERYKGHDRLIAAWRDVAAAVPRARLVVAGDGDDRPRLEALARSEGVADRVRFAGFVTREQLDALYAHAALFAMPSRGEGFGVVYLEAMAHGLPCLGSIHDAAGEIIVDGETGRLVDPDDTQALAQTLIAMLRDEPARLAQGAAGRARVAARFTYAQFRDRVTTVLERAFEHADRSPAPVDLRG